MYLCYVDESGDPGAYKPESKNSGTSYFILTGIVVKASDWRNALQSLKQFRQKLAKDGLLPFDTEFHCAELKDPHKSTQINSLTKLTRWDLIKRFAETIGQHKSFKIIAVFINKEQGQIQPEHYLEVAVEALYKAYDELLEEAGTKGIVFFDRGSNEKKLTDLAGKLLGTRGTPNAARPVVQHIIEDPILKISENSFFVQAADMAAYTLKEQELPKASRKKLNADKIFDNCLSKSCYQSSASDADGIIRPG